MASNLLDVKFGQRYSYTCGLESPASPSLGKAIFGTLILIVDVQNNGKDTVEDIWANACIQQGNSDGTVYVFQVTSGSQQYTYIGKTLGTLKSRYGGKIPVDGGLSAALSQYQPGRATVSLSIYNVSNPALVEGWCFQWAQSLKLNLTNKQDPS